MQHLTFPFAPPAWRCARKAAAAVVMAAAGWLAAMQPAHAQLWFYVDTNGTVHFSAEQLDARYLRFSMSPLRAGDAPLVVPAHTPGGAKAPTAADGLSDSDRQRLKFMVEESPGYQRHARHIRTAAQKHGIEEALLKAVATAESGFNAQAVSPKGAIGLMQVIPATAERFGLGGEKTAIEQKLKDPAINVPVGARYLVYLQKMFPERLDLVLAAYNAGEGAVQRHGNKIPPYKETQNYVKTVMSIYHSLQPARAQAPSVTLGGAQLSGSPSDQSRLRMVIPNEVLPAATP